MYQVRRKGTELADRITVSNHPTSDYPNWPNKIIRVFISRRGKQKRDRCSGRERRMRPEAGEFREVMRRGFADGERGP